MPQATKTLSKPTIILSGFLGTGMTTFLNHLINNNPEKKYAIIENELPYILQSVGKRLDFTKYPQAYSGENMQSRIVFIGKNLQAKSFERLLNRCF